MLEYKIVEEQYLTDLVANVNDAIKQGWLPQGGASIGLSVSQGHNYQSHIQAMTRQLKEPRRSNTK